ncbi:MAG: hypothetical protein WAX57_02450, partial [Minisyncoccia bacterium]
MTSRTYFLLGIGALAILIGVFFYSDYRFTEALDSYTVAARGHDSAAYLPGSTTNATRRILNRLLREILTGKHSKDERLALAHEGLEALEVSEQEIDAIGTLAENVTDRIQSLESRITLIHSADKKELLELATKRFDTASDIRGLSYLANHHIGEIFNRIIKDGGELTAEHS